MLTILPADSVPLTRSTVSAGPVVVTLAVITLVAVVAVLAVTYFMHLRDRR